MSACVPVPASPHAQVSSPQQSPALPGTAERRWLQPLRITILGQSDRPWPRWCLPRPKLETSGAREEKLSAGTNLIECVWDLALAPRVLPLLRLFVHDADPDVRRSPCGRRAPWLLWCGAEWAVPRAQRLAALCAVGVGVESVGAATGVKRDGRACARFLCS